MVKSNFDLFLLVILFAMSACSSTDDGLEATVAAQNTRIAELSSNPAVEATSLPQEQIESTPTSNAQLPTDPLTPTVSLEHGTETPALVWSMTLNGWSIAGYRAFVATQDNIIQARAIGEGDISWTSTIQGQLLGADVDNVYVSPSSQRIDALDTNTGEIKWTALLEETISPNATPIIANGILVYTPSNTYVWIERETGQTLQIPFSYNDILSTGNILILEPEIGQIVGFSLDTKQALWEVSGNLSESALCGNLFVHFGYEGDPGSEEIILEAIDPKSGTSIWKIDEPVGNAGYEPHCFNKNPTDIFTRDRSWLYLESESESIYLSSESGEALIALDRQNGEIRWSGNGKDYEWLGVIGSQVIYSHEGFGLTQAYDARTHELLWENTQAVLGQVVGIVDWVSPILMQKPEIAVDSTFA